MRHGGLAVHHAPTGDRVPTRWPTSTESLDGLSLHPPRRRRCGRPGPVRGLLAGPTRTCRLGRAPAPRLLARASNRLPPDALSIFLLTFWPHILGCLAILSLLGHHWVTQQPARGPVARARGIAARPSPCCRSLTAGVVLSVSRVSLPRCHPAYGCFLGIPMNQSSVIPDPDCAGVGSGLSGFVATVCQLSKRQHGGNATTT